MLPALHKYIRTHALLKPGDRLGVAVSGGADSVALLRALLGLRSELGVVLSVVHVHHGIRGADADADEQFVADLAQHFDLPLHLHRGDVPGHSRQEKLSLETAARNVRYAFFQQLLESGACDKIATAHTLDDQAETVLLRVLRGTGTRGLAAIPPFRNASADLTARIVRPFLGTSRHEIEAYLGALQQPWREDATNRDPRHLRNRIRHALLPVIERDFNPSVRSSLVNLAEIARAEEEHWSAELARLEPLIARPDQIDRAAFLRLPLALQRRLLVSLADRLDLPVAFDDIELMLHLAANPGSAHDFEDHWRVTANKTHLTFERVGPIVSAAPYDLCLSVPGEVELPAGSSLKARLLQPGEAAGYNPAILLAYNRLQLPLRVRNWQPGDRFQPAGHKQPEKLKRLFLEHRIPAPARAVWPVVLSGSNIVWVRGFPVATDFQAQAESAVLIEALSETRHE